MLKLYNAVLMRRPWLAAGCAIFAFVCPAHSAEMPASFSTPAGIVELRPGAGPVCGSDDYDNQCTVLTINGKIITAEHEVSVTTILPDLDHPDVFGANTSTGGNACCWESFLVDVSRRPERVFKGYALNTNTKPLLAGRNVTFEMIDGADKLGDPVIMTYRYRIGSGSKPTVYHSKTTYIKDIFAPSKDPQNYAYDVVSDPVARRPLLKLVGEGQYATFQRYFEASEPVRKVEGRYIVGEGIITHQGTSRGIFVIDTRSSLAWAVTVDGADSDKGTGRRWGVLTPADQVPRKEIEAFLARATSRYGN